MVDFINMPQVTDKPRDVYNAFCHGRGESNTQLFFFFFFFPMCFSFYIYITPVNNLPLGVRKPQRFTNIYNEQYN
jgi:hypothetical protein